MSRETEATSGSKSDSSFIFSGTIGRVPLDELRSIHQKKQKSLVNLGEDEKARLYSAAYEIARSHLAAHLGEEG